MPSTSYNKDDIPCELQRLIDHTDRGIEQLYQLAGRSANIARGVRRRSHRRASGERRAQRDRYYYDPAKALRASAHPCNCTKDLNNDGGRRGRRTQRDPFPESNSDEEYLEDEEEESSDCSDREVSNMPGHGKRHASHVHNGQRGNQQLRANRLHAPSTRPHRSSSSSTSTHNRGNASLQISPASTPNRATNYYKGALSSSPASLKKPPYTPQPNLPSPSSFLSTSLPNLSHSAPQIPPWQQRRQQREKRRGHASTIHSGIADEDNTSNAYRKASRGATGSKHGDGSPSFLSDNTAYYTHVAAQQSTQKPDSVAHASAAARQRRRRSLHFPDADEDAVTAATLDAFQPMQDSFAYRDASFEEAASRHKNGYIANTSSASAGMLSRFGKRWGAVFEDMLTAPPPAATAATLPVKQARAKPSREERTSRGVPSESSTTSSPSCTPADEVEEKSEEETPAGAKERLQRAKHAPAAPPPTSSTSIHTATEALAARSRASPHASAVPSPNTSGMLLQQISSPSLLRANQSVTDARLIEQLRAELKANEEAMLQLRMNHAREMAEARQSFALERATATKHTADELSTTYGIQQQLLQSSLQTERERLADVEEQLRLTRREAAQRKLDLTDATHALEVLQSKYTTLASTQQELVTQSAQWRAQTEKASAINRQLEAQEKVWKAKEVDWHARESELQKRIRATEERLQQQETSAQEMLAQVEAEFTQTSQSYQELLAEATKRMSYLEKSHRKYKVLKESHGLLKTEHAQLVESTMQRTQRYESEITALRAEVQELRQQLHQRDSASKEASESYQETLKDYKRRLDLQEANAAEHAQTLQQHINTANHTIELLRSQLEGAKRELLEEQGRSQQQQMEAAQAELQAKENLAEQQRSAAAYKVRTDDVIAQQKRQLREKDAKMQALAAGAAEPLQRLREQLDDERGRRARLEEQLKTYKRKAKEAEEHAAAEIRREQLRNALLATPSPSASASVPQRLLRSATATPLLHNTSTPRPFFAGAGNRNINNNSGSGDGGGGAPPAVHVGYVGRRTTTVSSSAGGSNLRGASPVHMAQPAAVVRGTMSPEGVRLNEIKKPKQLLPQRSPLHTPTSPPVVDVLTPPPHRPALLASSKADVVASVPAADGTAVDRPRTPTPTLPHPAVSHERRPSRREKCTALELAAGVADTTAISPNATVQSLSGISRSSPYTSTLLGDGELETATAAGTAATIADPGSARNSSRRPKKEEGVGEEGRGGAASSGFPWYAQEARQRDTSKEEHPQLHPHEVLPSSSFSSPPVTAALGHMDAGMQEHEERMRTFHSSALEVMRRFASSRQEALARCADIVKQTAAERRRDAQPRYRRGNGGHTSPAADVATTDSSGSEGEP